MLLTSLTPSGYGLWGLPCTCNYPELAPTVVLPSLQDPLPLSSFTVISGLILSSDRWPRKRCRQIDPVCLWESGSEVGANCPSIAEWP